MREKTHRLRQHGFTLLELLVAISVFATMSVMAYGGLRNVIDNSNASERSMQRMKDVQTSVSLLSRDLSHLFKRDIRDEYGNPQDFLQTEHDPDILIEFTRSGRRNPAGLARSSLQRAAYRLIDGTLVRLSWPQLDRAPGVEPYESEVIDKVKSLEIRFFDDTGNSHSQWPPLNSTSATGAAIQLTGIEMTLELEDWGKITRIYSVTL